MGRSLRFRIVNVFAETAFGGNPLCVFEEADGLREEEMLSLARQFNLSETAFILRSRQAAAKLRIFTPERELPFAGHPVLGAAHVVRECFETEDAFVVELGAGTIPVEAKDGAWFLTAPAPRVPEVRAVAEPPAQIAAVLSLQPEELAGPPHWVDTGSPLLVVPVRTPGAVRRACPNSALLEAWPENRLGRRTVYVFAHQDVNRRQVLARYFSAPRGGAVREDPGTGSACANLGGWLVHCGEPLPARLEVSQGEAVHRPSRLLLEVDGDGTIRVGGAVRALAAGTVSL